MQKHPPICGYSERETGVPDAPSGLWLPAAHVERDRADEAEMG